MPEISSQLMSSRLPSFGRLFFNFFFRNTDHQLFGFRKRNDLLNGEKHVVPVFERGGSKALHKHSMFQEPQNRGCHLFPELSGYHDQALVVPWIQDDFGKILLSEKITYQCLGVSIRLRLVKVLLKDLAD